MKICNIWNHFSTITRHRNLVRKHCFQIGLYWQGLTHDLSKYSPEEFWTGVRYYQGNRSPMQRSVRPWGIPGPGFTIRAGTSTIMSIGLTFPTIRRRAWWEIRCLCGMWLRWSATG